MSQHHPPAECLPGHPELYCVCSPGPCMLPLPSCSFQSPVEIPGVSNIDFLRIATNARRKAGGQKDLDPLEFYAHVMPKVDSNSRTSTLCFFPPFACAPFCCGLEVVHMCCCAGTGVPREWHAQG